MDEYRRISEGRPARSGRRRPAPAAPALSAAAPARLPRHAGDGGDAACVDCTVPGTRSPSSSPAPTGGAAGERHLTCPVSSAATELGLPVSHTVDDVLSTGADLGVLVLQRPADPAHVVCGAADGQLALSLLPRWRGRGAGGCAPLLAGDRSPACASWRSTRPSTPETCTDASRSRSVTAPRRRSCGRTWSTRQPACLVDVLAGDLPTPEPRSASRRTRRS